ncbi:MAG: SH3 domain-containing protein [Gammaproteobacteria bacterium]
MPTARLALVHASLWLALAVQPSVVWAETVYVSQALKLAVHEKASLDSAVIRLVPMGASLELLQRKGPISHVRIGNGVAGWVQSTSLTDQPPATAAPQTDESAQLIGIRAELKDMEQRAIIAETKLLTLNATGAATQRREEDPAPDTGEAQASESSETDTPADGANDPGPREPTPSAPVTMDSEALRDLERLALENQRLRAQLKAAGVDADAPSTNPADVASAAGIADAARNHADPNDEESGALGKMMASVLGDGEAGPVEWLPAWNRWQWLFSLSGVLLAFALGAWIVDASVRRRMGGFSV